MWGGREEAASGGRPIDNRPQIANLPHCQRARAATPGNSIPARNSSDAPPPVETCEILSATPAALMAFSESPPPTTEIAPEVATALARATVPLSNGGFSKIPMGPFQITVLAPAITWEKAAIVLGPISTAILPSGVEDGV